MLSVREKLSLVLITAAALSLFLYGSYKLPFIGPDEPRYSQVAREMHETGDFIVPRLANNPWFEKPVLLYWLISISYSLFGVNEFTARLPSALSALVTVMITGLIVKKVTDLTTGVVAAVVLATCIFFLGFSHAATFDMLLTATITGAFTAFLLYELDRSRVGQIYLFYILTGVAVLAKGFVALILIGIGIAAYFVVQKRTRDLFKLKFLRGSVLSLLMMSIWFVPITLKYGAQFWNDFFLQHHLMRYTSSQYHQSGGPFFYIPVLIVGTFPWTFAPLLGVPKADNPRKRLLICLSLCWFLSTLIFFSLSSSKLPGYILPAIPAYAMLCALSIVDFFRRPSATRKKPILILILLNLVFIPALLIGGAARPALHFPIVVMSTCVVVITFLTGVLITKKQFANALSMYALLAVTAAVLTVQEAPARLHWYESKLLSSQIQPVLSRGVKLALYNVYDFSFVFYTNGRVDLTPKGYFIPLRNYVDLHRYVTAKGEALVLVGNEELTWMQQADFWKVVHIFRGNERSIVQIAARTH